MATDPTLAELFQAQRQGLCGIVRSVLGSSADAAEVLQDSFLRCWRSWQRGDRPSDLVAWIFVVTWNVAVDQRRRQKRRPEPAAFDEETIVHKAAAAGPSRAVEQQEEVQRAQRAIERLADHEKQVFLLRVSGGLSFAAVAQALAIPEGTAKTRMRAALARLRLLLGVTQSGSDAISQDQGTQNQGTRT